MSDTCQIHSSNNDFSTQKASDKVGKHENNLAMKKLKEQNQSQYKSIYYQWHSVKAFPENRMEVTSYKDMLIFILPTQKHLGTMDTIAASGHSVVQLYDGIVQSSEKEWT